MFPVPSNARSELQAILNAADTVIFKTNTVGTVEIFNPAAERMLGWIADEVVGKLTSLLWHDPREVAARAAELSQEQGKEIATDFEVFIFKCRNQVSEKRQWTFVRKNGSCIPVLLTVSAIRDASGTITGYLGMAEELTATLNAVERRNQFFTPQPDGSLYLVGRADSAAPLQDKGEVTGVELEFQDRSKDRALEVQLQKSNAELEKQIASRTEELLKEQRRLRHGNLVLESIASDNSFHETMQLITKFVADEGAVTRCGILLFDDKHRRIQLGANRNLPEDLVETLLEPLLDERANWLWQAFLSGQRAIVKHPCGADLVTMADLATTNAWRFSWVEPIISGDGKVVGGFVTFKEQGGPPSEDELTLVECACRLARFVIQRVQNRASLEASEERHRTLLKHFPAPVFVYDRETLRYLAVSDRAVDEYGYTREEFMQMTIADIRPEEDLPALLKMLSESGTNFEHRGLWRHRRRNGNLIDVEITTHGLELAGRPACIVLTQDVTDKIQAENALRRSEALNLAILQSSLDSIVTMNCAGQIVEFNRAAEDAFGYTKSEAMGRLVGDLMIPPDLRTAHAHGLARYLATGEHRIICKRIQTTALRSNGQTFPVELTVIPVVVDGEQLFTAFMRDLTVAQHAERELHRTTELLHAIANGTTDAIFVKDTQGRYLLFNRAASLLTGRRVDEVLGKDDIFLFGENHGRLVMENDRQVMLSNEPHIVEEELAAAGMTRSYHAMKAPLRDPRGNVVGMIGISRDVTERKHMESALRASEERYRSIVEQSPDMIFVNRDDRISFINQAGVNLLGASSTDQLLGRSPLEHVHPDNHSMVKQRIATLRLGPSTVPVVEQRMIALDGRVIAVDAQATSYYSDGKLEIQVVCRDITARKKAEQELRRQVRHADFSAAIGLALSHSPTLQEMLQSCAEAMVAHLDAAFARVWAFNEQEGVLELQASAGTYTRLDGTHARVTIGQKKIGRIAAMKLPHLTNSVYDDPQIGDQEWARAQGFISFAGYPLLIGNRCAGVVAMFGRKAFEQDTLESLAMATNGIAQNIERKQAEVALAELNTTLEQRVIQRTLELKSSEQFNQATLDALSAHVAVVDRDGRIVATNAAWRKFAVENGADFQSVSEGANYVGTCEAGRGDADAAIVANALREVLAGRCSAWSHEYPCHSSTEQRWYICQVTLGYINQQPHAVVAHENITTVKLAQEELREAKEKAVQASKSKSEFLATMSHELRTPLNGILGMNQLLLTTELNERQREYVAACSTSGELLLQLINDILDLSKIEAGKLELDPRECGVEAFTYDVVDMMSHSARTKQLVLNCRVTPDACVVGSFDDSRLRQVLVNLVSNSIKFTSSGSIDVSVERIAAGDRTARLRFAVSDTGIGIPQERLDRLFKSFSQVDSSTTRQFGGTGLGLSICKQLIELMGGEIGVDSQVGVGTTFWFEIEIAIVMSELTSTAEQERQLLEGTRIIGIGDLEEEHVQVVECLRGWGCQFQHVATVQDALAEVDKAVAAGHPFRFVFSNCSLVTVDEIVKLRDLITRSGLQIIGLGTPPDGESRNQLLRLGVQFVLDDPIRPRTLLDELIEALSVGKSVASIPKAYAPFPIQPLEKFSGHILVAEDNSINQLYINELLKNFGCTSDLAKNGEEVLVAVQRRHYDLVLMDCQMPEMDGFTATQEIRKREAAIEGAARLPIVALTANALKGDRERCLNAGMDEYVSKPVEAEHLRDVLSKYLSGISIQK